MANTRFQHKRSSVSGVVPTTGDIASGELGINLADAKLFTSNGSTVFELGSNLTSLAVGNSTVRQIVNTTGAFVNGSINLTRNDQKLTFTPTAGGTNVYFVLQSDDNFVFYTTNTTGGAKAVFNVYANTNTPNQNSAIRFNVPVDMGSQGLFANNSLGSSGQVLTSTGTGVYWATPSGGLSGGELFNINVSNATGYAVNTTMSAAFTAPATAGIEYIVHSIQVTNISAANANISGEFSGTTYANITFATSVPVPRESAVELLKMPKVLQPNDILRLQANTASALHAYITIESVTSTAYFGSGVDVTADATFADLFTATGNSVITSVLLSNDDGTNDVKARVVWTDGSNNIQGYLCFDMIIPARGTVELLEKVKFLPNGHKIRVYANAGNRLEAIISGKTL